MADFQKLGPHGIQATGDVLTWAAKAPIVKAVGSPNILRVARPDAIKIWRWYFEIQDINRNGAFILEAALGHLGDAPCDLIELYNETAQHGYEGLDRYITFHEEAVAYLESIRPDLPASQRNLQILGYSFSTGCPEQADWELLRRRKYGGVKVIGLHCYWGRQGYTEWHALRYRKAHEWTEGDHPPFVISECGIDAIEGGPKGWKLWPMSGQQYLDQLKGYDTELAKDTYVIGGTPFTGGPTPDWNNFNTDELLGMMKLTPLAPVLTIPKYPQEEPMPDNPIHNMLKDIWTRQGANWNDEDAFCQTALALAGLNGEIIYPMPSKDGNWQNLTSYPGYIVAYMNPVYSYNQATGEVFKGLPPF